MIYKSRHKRKVCVLVSGGIESACLVKRSLDSGSVVYPVYVRGGHAWEKIEFYWLKRLLRALHNQRLKPLSILELPVHDCYRQAQWSLSGRQVPSARTRDERVYLPGRNIFLLAKAAVFCAERGISRIALGTLGSNPFPDASPAFFKAIAVATSLGLNAPLKIETPFTAEHKEQVIAGARGVPWQYTFSCIAPFKLKHCGRCNKCAERKKAFRAARLKDPTDYRD